MKKNKRQKNYFNSFSEVASLWASQSQSSARCRNGFFEGNKIYSYGRHYLAGQLANYRGHKIALINSSNYSKTTNGHLSDCAWRARQSKFKIIKFNFGEIKFNKLGLHKSLSIHFKNELESLQNRIILAAEKLDLCHWRIEKLRYDIRLHNKLVGQLGFKKYLIKPLPKSFWRLLNDSAELARHAHLNWLGRKQLFIGLGALAGNGADLSHYRFIESWRIEKALSKCD